MKILLTNDFSDAMLNQEKSIISTFLGSLKKIRDLTKTEILALDTVVDLSSLKDKTKLFAYNVEEQTYVVFSFTKKNEMILIDYVKLHNGSVISLTYPDISEAKG